MTASPCTHVDLPQTLLEPILTKRAIHAGWSVRFNTSFVRILSRTDLDPSTAPHQKRIVSEIRDDLTQHTYTIRSRYLFGCDGARSQVARALSLPLVKKPGQGLAINVLVKADLSRHMPTRSGNLHWIVRPDEDPARTPVWAWAALARMIRPWDEWMFIFLPAPGADVTLDAVSTATPDAYVARVRECIGDPTVDVELRDVSRWWINETVAERYSDGGHVFCLGDATHRHPPFNGLGSNTCVQDAYNLAWKVHLVMAGTAGPALLETFTAERQPVGAGIVARANQGLRDHAGWQAALGMLETDKAERGRIWDELGDAGPAGRARREAFRRGIERTDAEFHGLGVEMGQVYVSDAVVREDEPAAAAGAGPTTVPAAADEVREYIPSTLPGKRLPHVWLNTRVPGDKVSTQDLAGHGRFCLLTGPGGERWKEAAREVGARLGVEVVSYSIGWKQDYEDVYFDWARRREVDEDGCVLVRPDRFVAWRAREMVKDSDPAEKLEGVMRKVLAL